MASEADLTRVKGIFPRSTVWDADTQKLVDRLRAHINRQPAPTITELQDASIKPRPVPDGSHRTSHVFPPPSQEGAAECFRSGILTLGNFRGELGEIAPVRAEWTGVRERVPGDARSPRIAETGQGGTAQAVEPKVTIFHVHGGNMFQGSPSSYQHITSRLAKLSGGRVISVEYRLCPRHQLPVPLLDVFIAYLSLLYPPAGSAYDPVDPSTVVFTGDSSGGVLLICLLLLIQQTRNLSPFSFHSHLVNLPLPSPAGLAIWSPVGEMLQSMPSRLRNRVHDLFLESPWVSPSYPSCGIWPTSPPSPVMYCRRADDLHHPLLVPCGWDDWRDFPPMWFAGGQEIFYDGAKVIARKAAQQGVSVTWLEFEAMPHCFFMQPTLSRSRQSSIAYERWASFVKNAVSSNTTGRSGHTGVNASKISFCNLEEEQMALEQREDPPLESIPDLLNARIEHITARFESEWRDFRRERL